MDPIVARILKEHAVGAEPAPQLRGVSPLPRTYAPVQGIADTRSLNPDGTPQMSDDEYVNLALRHILQGRANPNLATKFGPLPVPFEPMTPASNNAGRSILRGLVSGYNAQYDRRGVQDDRNLTNLLRLQEQKRYNDARIQGIEDENARRQAKANAAGAAGEEVDPFLGEKRRWWEARIDAAKAGGEASRALAARRNRPDQPRAAGGGGSRGGASAGGTYTQAAAQLNRRASAEKARVTNAIRAKGAASGWSEEEIRAGVARKVSEVEAQRQYLLKQLDETYGREHPEAPDMTPESKPDPLGLR